MVIPISFVLGLPQAVPTPSFLQGDRWNTFVLLGGHEDGSCIGTAVLVPRRCASVITWVSSAINLTYGIRGTSFPTRFSSVNRPCPWVPTSSDSSVNLTPKFLPKKCTALVGDWWNHRDESEDYIEYTQKDSILSSMINNFLEKSMTDDSNHDVCLEF